eukprot:scaffold1.g5531.t1
MVAKAPAGAAGGKAVQEAAPAPEGAATSSAQACQEVRGAAGSEPALPGGPALSFSTRMNLLWAGQSSYGSCLVLAITCIIAWRCWHLLCRAGSTWLLVSAGVAAADIAWRLCYPRSYARWRELPAALLRLNSFAPPAAWLLMRRLLDDGARSGGTPCWGIAAHATRLLFASGAAKMALLALTLRVRFGLSAALQVALLLASARHTRGLCRAAPLALRAGRRATHELFTVQSTLAGLVTCSLPTDERPSAFVECAALLTFLRLAIAVVLPLAYEAASQSRLFAAHQAQRRRAGLPPERGAHAALYSAAGWAGARSCFTTMPGTPRHAVSPFGPVDRAPSAARTAAIRGAPELPGGPELSFHTRLNLLWEDQCSYGSWLAMAFTLIIAWRCWRMLCPASCAWLLVSGAAATADIAWRRRAPQAHARWRELPAAVLRLNSFGPAAAWVLMRRLLEDHGLPAAADSAWATAVHAAHLLFACGAAKMAALALSLRVRLGFSAAIQAALVLASTRHTRALCGTAPLVHPAGRRMIHELFLLASTLAGLVTCSLPTAQARRSAPAECAVLLTFLRLAIAIVLTLTYEAASQSRLFAAHQAQRQRAGLPPERGVHAALYSAAGRLCPNGRGLHAGVALLLLVAACWEACAASAG